MKYYFKLQYRRSIRFFEERGFSPILSFLLLGAVFTGGTYLLTARTEYAGWIILLIQLLVLTPLNCKERVDHLKVIFKKGQIFKIRMIENFLLSFPFFISLLFVDGKLILVSWGVLLLIAVRLLRIKMFRSIPTPFKNYPVILPSGFRRLSVLHFLLVLLGVFAAIINNYNLALSTVVGQWIVLVGYYHKSEPVEYVWVYSLNPSRFLKKQVKDSWIGASIIILPVVIFLILINAEAWYLPVVIYILGILNLTNLILVKYTDFPDETTLANGVIASLGVLLPPLLIFMLPYFYRKAKTNLKQVL